MCMGFMPQFSLHYTEFVAENHHQCHGTCHMEQLLSCIYVGYIVLLNALHISHFVINLLTVGCIEFSNN